MASPPSERRASTSTCSPNTRVRYSSRRAVCRARDIFSAVLLRRRGRRRAVLPHLLAVLAHHAAHLLHHAHRPAHAPVHARPVLHVLLHLLHRTVHVAHHLRHARHALLHRRGIGRPRRRRRPRAGEQGDDRATNQDVTERLHGGPPLSVRRSTRRPGAR